MSLAQRITQDLSQPEMYMKAFQEWFNRRKDLAHHQDDLCIEKNVEFYNVWMCCPEHRAIAAERAVLEAWATAFHDIYEMKEIPHVGEPFSAPWLFAFCRKFDLPQWKV